jgi:hypothetical protein
MEKIVLIATLNKPVVDAKAEGDRRRNTKLMLQCMRESTN